MVDSTVANFCAALDRAGIRRLAMATVDGRFRASHPDFEELAATLSREPDFDDHEGFFIQVGPLPGLLYGASVHRTVRGAGAGGVRFWRYSKVGDFFRDGLRLGRAMTRKNSLAGLWWGGGKGVMSRPDDLDAETRRTVYRGYGDFMTSLRGCYVTAEDAGTTTEDMAQIFARTRFTTCIPEELGGSGNPSGPTARGVVCAMEAALSHLGQGSLEGKKVAVQGLGNVGRRLVGNLLEAGVSRVEAADIDPQCCQEALRQYGGERLQVRSTAPEEVLFAPVDIASPCALGGGLNPHSIPRIRAPIVCGAANNQLLDPDRDARTLQEHGITYVPDFVANRMGIVNCADEQYGYLPEDPGILRHLGREWENSIYQVTLKILREARLRGVTPSEEADRLADDLSLVPHPIWGHRGQQIVAAVFDDWSSA